MPGPRRLVRPLSNAPRRRLPAITRYGALVLSCEHASNRVPVRYAAVFDSDAARAALSSHRGWDIGALALARALGKRLGCAVFEGKATRLLVDLNRSQHHPKLLSEFSRVLPPDQRAQLLAAHYLPYVHQVHGAVDELQARFGRVVHLSVHSFTPVLDGEVRNADMGLLYDPRRAEERTLSQTLRVALKRMAPTVRVRLNYPYRGIGDGMVTSLRRRFSPEQYTALEIELNQGTLQQDPSGMKRALLGAVSTALLPTERSPRPTKR